MVQRFEGVFGEGVWDFGTLYRVKFTMSLKFEDGLKLRSSTVA